MTVALGLLFGMSLRADVFSNVPEASAYTPVYQLAIPNAANYQGANQIAYSVDNSGLIRQGYDRVAYYLELDDGSGLKWVYVSMEDFAGGNVRALGIPHSINNPVLHQTIVRDMNVSASANLAGTITTGTGIQTGNVEMWPSNYGGGNAAGIPNATGSFDFGDGGGSATGTGYGSFQVHNHGASQVIFAYNRWGANNGNDDVGIGNRPATSNTDYTFAQNAATYTVKNLQILVRQRTTVPYALRRQVPEAATYELVYDLAIPNGQLSYNTNTIPYLFTRTGALPAGFGRVAYALDLDSKWVYVSVDPFTRQLSQLGVPSNGPNGNGGTTFRQFLGHMNVFASAGAGVATGTDIGTGNMEFYHGDYSGNNAGVVPNAADDMYDFGDTPTSGGYACMQLHNYDIDGAGPGTSGETIMAFNDWGANGVRLHSDLGIGNRPSGYPDWTFAANANAYLVKRLRVLAQPAVFANVPEAADFKILYSLNIPNKAGFRNAMPIPYAIDNSDMDLPDGYDRVAYYMELVSGATTNWVYASMDDFVNQELTRLGMPHNVDNPVAHQRFVNNMNVYASAGSGIVTGTGLTTGNIEMWPSNYGQGNGLGVPNASGSAFDFGDDGAGAGAGHGCFQVHNHGADLGSSTGQILFAYNNWGGNNPTANSDLGIGNRPTGQPDWTFGASAASYSVKYLQVLVRSRSASLTETVRERVEEADQYELLYDLDIPNGARHNYDYIPYTVDRSDTLLDSIGRVAYYVELDSTWLYVSMDAFSQNLAELGVPSRGANGGAIFQQPVTNMNVYAAPGVAVHRNLDIQTGNIEFWPDNYTGTKDPVLSPPNAAGNYDFGDTRTAGDHACMQIHNSDIDGAGPGTVGQTLFAYNNWGNNLAGPSALGIGNSPSGNPDWTFNNNANTYGVKHLQVLVRPRLFDLVPAAANYKVAYALRIPRGGATDFNGHGVPYTIDHSAELAGEHFGRVAYYLELKEAGQPLKWVFVSFDALTQDITKIGVPSYDTGVLTQQTLANMDVYASAGAGVTTGTEIGPGNIEFWPNNYGTANLPAVPGANGSTYDFGDDVDGNVPLGYGSMQIHNHGAGETVFSYSGWGTPGIVGCVGIGNQPSDHPDWTHNDNAAGHEVANLCILILLPPPSTQIEIR